MGAVWFGGTIACGPTAGAKDKLTAFLLSAISSGAAKFHQGMLIDRQAFDFCRHFGESPNSKRCGNSMHVGFLSR